MDKSLMSLLFSPKNKKDLRAQYPELKTYQEFMPDVIGKEELYFVYYFVSYFGDMKPKDKRIETSFKMAFGEGDTRYKLEDFLVWDIPENIRAACDRWALFDAPARLLARMTYDKAFENIIDIINIDKTEFEGEDAFENKGRYINSVQKAMEILPQIIQQKEAGFGFKDDMASIEEATGKTLSMWHKQKQDGLL